MNININFLTDFGFTMIRKNKDKIAFLLYFIADIFKGNRFLFEGKLLRIAVHRRKKQHTKGEDSYAFNF